MKPTIEELQMKLIGCKYNLRLVYRIPAVILTVVTFAMWTLIILKIGGVL